MSPNPEGPPSVCPVCRFAGSFPLVESYHDPLGDKDYGSYLCRACEVVFAHPFRHPGAQWYAKFSPEDSYEGLGSWRFDWALSAGFRPAGRLLDVGCGTGNFLVQAKSQGYQVVGLDVNPEAVKAARRRGLEVHQESLEEFARKNPPESFDVITLFDVLEHFDDPSEVAAACRGLLKSGGGLFVTTPNGYRPTPFGREDFDSPPHHLSRWTPEALEAFMKRQGFAVVLSYYTYLPTWEFSRFFVAWATARSLSLAKSLLYGRSGREATLTQLVGKEPGSGKGGARGVLLGLIRDKSARVRLVNAFQTALGWMLVPVFFPMKVYYRLIIPKAGCTTCLLVRKEDGGPGGP